MKDQCPLHQLKNEEAQTEPRPFSEEKGRRLYTEHFLKLKKRLNQILADNTGKDPEQVKQDSERDHWMLAEEAREYGLVDKVIYKR